jgi:PAS domain S-box-containing protein
MENHERETLKPPRRSARSRNSLSATGSSFRLLESFPCPVRLAGLDGQCKYVNRAWLELTGRTLEEELGNGWSQGIHPDDLERYLSSYRTALQNRTNFEMEYRLRGADGRYRWLNECGRTFFDHEENVAGYIGAGFDITNRKQMQAENLSESEARYRELFENSREAIYVHDLTGRYISMNRAAEKLSGYSRGEVLGKHFSNFVGPRHLRYARENLCRKLDIEGETTYEIDIITKDRRRVPVEVNSRLIFEHGVPVGVQGTARDVTERRRAQEALSTLSQRLIEAQEAERQSLARELHDDIGQAIAAVRIGLQSLQRSDAQNAFARQLDESIAIVDKALERVRELSHSLRPSLLDDLGLPAALRWYVDRYAQRTGIMAEVFNGCENIERLPPELETVCFRIAQEALTNVARHAKAKRVRVRLECDSERLRLMIADDGVGFEIQRFFFGAAATSLGLRGMNERASAVNGAVDIESGYGKGTRVCATFPLKPRK